MSESLQPHGLQHSRLPCPPWSLRVCSKWCQLSWWCHPTISSSCPLLPPFPLAFNLSQHQDIFQWVSSSHQVAKVYIYIWIYICVSIYIYIYIYIYVYIYIYECVYIFILICSFGNNFVKSRIIVYSFILEIISILSFIFCLIFHQTSCSR